MGMAADIEGDTGGRSGLSSPGAKVGTTVRRPYKKPLILSVLVLLVIVAVPALACVPGVGDNMIISALVDVTQELPGGG